MADENNSIVNSFGIPTGDSPIVPDDIEMPDPEDMVNPSEEDYPLDDDAPDPPDNKEDAESGSSDNDDNSNRDESTPSQQEQTEKNTDTPSSDNHGIFGADFSGSVSHKKESDSSDDEFEGEMDDIDKREASEENLPYDPNVSVSASVDSCGRFMPNTPQEKMQLIQKFMPQVWKMILQCNCCPKMIGLYDRCTPNLSCKDCWNRAVHIDTKTHAFIDANGSYVCSHDNGVLVFKRVLTKGSQLWQCPTCNTFFRITIDTPSKVVSAVKVNKGE